MNLKDMQEALKALDRHLPSKAIILIGGGSAMLLAYHIPLTTSDIDGLILSGPLTAAELDPLVKRVAKELGLSPHWYNDYFNTFTFSLPKDFRERLVPVYKGKNLTALALGKEDLLIMKCFAGREKDIGHARSLIRKGVDTEMVVRHLESLIAKGIPKSEEALSFVNDLLDEEG